MENSYLSAAHAGGEAERHALDVQAKAYLVDILSSVTNDIESLAGNVNDYVGIQADAVNSLTNQVDVVKNRILLSKTSLGLEKLNEMQSLNEISTISTNTSNDISRY